MKLKGTVLLIGLLCATGATAGQKAGNGGDVVVCRAASQRIHAIELLDFYEARTTRGIQTDLSAADGYREKLELILERLERISSIRAKQYRAWALEFENNALFLGQVTLTDIPDSDHLVIPAGCAVEQIAIQREPVFPQDKRYTINRDLWNALDENGKAGLILHELVYREAISVGHPNSISTRYFTSVLASSAMDAMTQKSFIETLQALPFEEFSAWDIPIQIVSIRARGDQLSWTKSTLTYRSDGSILTAKSRVPGNAPYNFLPGYLWGGRDLYFDNCPLSFHRNGRIHEFTGNCMVHYDGEPQPLPTLDIEGRVTALKPNSEKQVVELPGVSIRFPNYWTGRVDLDATGRAVSAKGAEASFTVAGVNFKVASRKSSDVLSFENGKYRQGGYLSEATTVRIGDEAATLQEGAPIEFHPNGVVSLATLKGPATLYQADGGATLFAAGAHLKFNERGQVIASTLR